MAIMSFKEFMNEASVKYKVVIDTETPSVKVTKEGRIVSEYTSIEDFTSRYHSSQWFKNSPSLYNSVKVKVDSAFN